MKHRSKVLNNMLQRRGTASNLEGDGEKMHSARGTAAVSPVRPSTCTFHLRHDNTPKQRACGSQLLTREVLVHVHIPIQ